MSHPLFSVPPGIQSAIDHISIPGNPIIPGNPVIPGSPVFDGGPAAQIIETIFHPVTVDDVVAPHDWLIL